MGAYEIQCCGCWTLVPAAGVSAPCPGCGSVFTQRGPLDDDVTFFGADVWAAPDGGLVGLLDDSEAGD